MRASFRIGPFRIELLPKFRVSLDVRRTIGKSNAAGKSNVGPGCALGIVAAVIMLALLACGAFWIVLIL